LLKGGEIAVLLLPLEVNIFETYLTSYSTSTEAASLGIKLDEA
jgi:hypothetical protein